MYVPVPGDLIFSRWCGITAHTCEVMIFLGETSTHWQACNFFDKSIKYTFALKSYSSFTLRSFCRFDIGRVSKKLKPKFQIGQTVSINGYNTYLFNPPIIAEIVHYRLRYNSLRKKCRIGYQFKILNEKQIDPKRLNRIITDDIYYAEEDDIKAYINYNKIWDILFK